MDKEEFKKQISNSMEEIKKLVDDSDTKKEMYRLERVIDRFHKMKLETPDKNWNEEILNQYNKDRKSLKKIYETKKPIIGTIVAKTFSEKEMIKKFWNEDKIKNGHKSVF